MKAYVDIFRLVWPLALGMASNALMQFVDRAFLARDSMESLEAVLPASMLSLILLGFFQAVVAYSGTYVANFHGAKDVRMCIGSYRAGCVLALVFGLATFAFIPLGSLIFETFSSGESLVAREKTYFSICTAGGIFLYCQMAAQSFFTGLGKTKAVFAVNIVGNVVNMVLDPVFIFGWLGLPAMGIAGAGAATVVALCVQWSLLAFLAEREIRKMKRGHGAWRPFWDGSLFDLIWRIIRFGVPSGGYSTLNLVSFTAFVFFAGRVGHMEAAVSNACFAINYLLFAPIEGFALGASTLVSQAKGARDHKAAKEAGWRVAVLATVITALLLALTLVFYRPILELFAPSEPELQERFISLGFTLLLLMAAWQIFEVFDTVLSGALKGAGDTSFVMYWMLIGAFAFWMPLLVVVSRFCNTMPALWATLVFEVVLLSIGTLARWRGGAWKKIEI